MSCHPHLFADRIVNLTAAGPLIRIELAALVPLAEEGDKPGLQPTQTLEMPLDGFLTSFAIHKTVVRKMVANGLINPRPAASTT